MALTQQQLDATRRYKAGEITSDQYKQAYVTNYDPTKDKSFGKNIAYSGTSSPEALRIQEMSQAYQNSVAPKPVVAQPVVQPVQMLPQQQLANAQKSQAVIELERARAKALSGLGAEQTSIAPKYEQGRSDLRRTSINQAKDFENFLATKGILASGTAGQGEIASNVALLGGLGQSKTAEANANADIERRRSDLETDFAFGVQSAEARAREQELERLYQQQTKASDRAYEEGLTAQEIARETAQNTQNQTREDFINTLGGIRDYSAQINTVQNDGDPSNDWQIPFLQQAKQEKIVNQNLDPQTGRPLPVDNTQQVWDAAYKKWNAGIPLTQQEMQVIGATTATKPKATRSGSSGGGSDGGYTPTPDSPPKEIISFVENSLRGTSGTQAADAIAEILNTGLMDNLFPSEVKSILKKFGVTDEMAEQADNRYEAKYYGVELPSGRTVMPTR